MTDASLLAQIFEAYPAPTFLVDDDVRVQLANRAGRELAGAGALELRALLRRGGELLHCVHATEHPGGCGRAESCRSCVVRGSVGAALTSGAVARRQARVELHRGGEVVPLTVLISAAPVEFEGVRLVVLTIEDVSELTRLRSLLPMCAGCGKVRGEGPDWHRVETYLKEHLDLDVSHGLCEACEHRLYPPGSLGGASGSEK